MDYSIYIIKQNTPESKLLHRAGINRNDLEVSKRKGRQQKHGGFGRRPVEWRLQGIRNVEKLCSTIQSILTEKNELTPQEKKSYSRATKTLEGIKKLVREEQRLKSIKEIQINHLKVLLGKKYPFLSSSHLNSSLTELSVQKFESLEALEAEFKALNMNVFNAYKVSKTNYLEIFRLGRKHNGS